MLISLTLFLSMDVYRGYDSRSGRDVLVSLLQKARSRAIQNYMQSPHGVCYDAGTNSFMVFRGGGYHAGLATNEPTPVGSLVVATTPSLFLCAEGSGVVFSQLSGTTTPTVIVLTQSGRIATTSINFEGMIDW